MKLKILFILFISVLFIECAIAQSSSSYSRLGVGDNAYSFSGRMSGMGGLGNSFADPDFINTINPAAWHTLNRTRIEFSGYYSGTILSNSSSSSFYGETEFSGFAFAFPASRLYGIGIAAGIIPVTNVSYNVVQDFDGSAFGIDDYSIAYEGSGGLSKIFVGSSYQLPFGFAIGAAMDYYFGNLTYLSSVDFGTSNNLNSEYDRTYSPRGLGSTVGFISSDFSSIFGSENISDFRIGASYSLVSKLSTDTILISNSSISIDTIAQGVVDMKIPHRLSAGMSLKFNNQYVVSVDYLFQPWSEFSFNQIERGNLRNLTKISFGIEGSPLQTAGQSFWEQIIWRAGLSFEQTQYVVNNVGINQYLISTGVSLPMGQGSSIDLALSYGMRGTKESNLFKENIVRLNFGISLGEFWFIRQEK
jgi:hypothetical protein